MAEPIIDTSLIDFDEYDVPALSEDLRELVNVAGAVRKVATAAVALAIAAGIFSVVVFGGGGALGAVLVFLVSALLAAVPATMVGVTWVARQRLDRVQTTSANVIDMVGRIHADFVRVSEGTASTTVRSFANGILNEAVLPLAFNLVGGFVEGMAGPLGFVVRRADGLLLRMVSQATRAAVDTLPDKRLGEMAPSELTTKVVEISDRVDREYGEVAGRVAGIVTKGSSVTFGVGTVAILATAIPLALWWLLLWAF